MKLAQKKKSIVLSDILAYNQLYWCSVFISLLGGFPSGGHGLVCLTAAVIAQFR